jgi:hypothetical protein
MSRVPLIFRDKAPLCKSHPALSVRQLSSVEDRAIIGTGRKYGLGIVGNFGGWFAADIDVDADRIGTDLVKQYLKHPLGTVRGNPEHVGKLLYRGQFPEPDDALKTATANYFTTGLNFTRTEQLLDHARQSDPASLMAVGR